jgi:hypothetical protein
LSQSTATSQQRTADIDVDVSRVAGIESRSSVAAALGGDEQLEPCIGAKGPHATTRPNHSEYAALDRVRATKLVRATNGDYVRKVSNMYREQVVANRPVALTVIGLHHNYAIFLHKIDWPGSRPDANGLTSGAVHIARPT